MSASISLTGNEYGAFGGGINGLVLSDSSNVRHQLDRLTQQAGDNFVSDSYAGLGGGASTALVLAPALADIKGWQANIAANDGTMQVTQTALSQISSVASNFYAQVDNLNGLDASTVDAIAANARGALQQVAGLLDEADGGSYVFAGQDSANPPVPNPNGILSSGFFTQIQTAVAGLSVNGAAATAASTLAVASSNAPDTSPFSATLSQPAAALAALRPTISVGPEQHAAVGILASANAAVTSLGGSTTGSYMRDIMRALATLGSLSSSQSGSPDFAKLVADTGTSLGGAVTALNQDAGVLGDQQARLQTQSTVMDSTAIALHSQLSAAQEVDMASTLSQLTQTQTRLQASYQLIASVQSLSLVKFLSPGG